jgi:hypothetical protein
VFGGPYDRRGLGLIKPGTPNRSQGQGRSSEQTRWSLGGCELALKLWAIWEGSLTTSQHFEPDLRNSAVRDYRGAAGNVAMVELCTHLADRKGKDGNPPPTAGAPALYPDPLMEQSTML